MGDNPLNDEQTARRRRDRRRARLLAFGLFLALGLAGEAIYAWTSADSLTVFSLALLTGAAAFLTGGLLGFLFGIPRTLASDTAPRTPDPARPLGLASSVRANTNLEQISDWLTKILVGLGLTQLGTIRSGAVSLFDSVGAALGDQPSNPVFAGAVIVYLTSGGFLTGWLLTRLQLGRWMTRADRTELETLAVDAKARGDVDAADAYQAKAAALRDVG